jgi:DNA polymerase III subunit alpha
VSYIPIHVHTHWSLLDSTLAINDLIERCFDYSIPAVCMTDHNNMKGVVEFHKTATSKGILPIIGVEFDLEHKEERNSRVTLLAKNKEGYKNLVLLVSLSNESIDQYGTPRLTRERLSKHNTGLICLMGDIFSEFSFSLFDNVNMAYIANSYEVCKEIVSKDWVRRCSDVITYYEKTFEHFFLYFDRGGLPIHSVIQQAVEYMGKGRLVLPSNNIHYLNKSDSHIHEILLKSKVENIKKVTDRLDSFHDYHIFFNDCPNVHINKSIERGEDTLVLLDIVENYDINENPILPKYKHDGETVKDPDSLLRDICREGFTETGLKDNLNDDKELLKVYIDRINYELEVFSAAGISSYFLIVKDIIDSVRNKGIPIDIRGSSSACLVSHLTQMSSIDPLRPDSTLPYHKSRELSFERFYNEGRNTEGNVSLADIDIDLPPTYRDRVIEYLSDVYGNDCVGHIITHSRFKGKGAIKEIFKLIKPTSNYFEIANDITKTFVEEAKISDELAEIQKDEPGYGIIRWNIDHIEEVANYYEEYKEIFDTAMRIEKVPKNEGVHAAGIIVADRPLRHLFPMRYSSKMDKMVIDIEGSDIEYLGGVKFDVLGVAALEKAYKVERMVNEKINKVEFGIV